MLTMFLWLYCCYVTKLLVESESQLKALRLVCNVLRLKHVDKRS